MFKHVFTDKATTKITDNCRVFNCLYVGPLEEQEVIESVKQANGEAYNFSYHLETNCPFGLDFSKYNCTGNIFYLFFNLESPADKQFILSFGRECRFQAWLDNECIMDDTGTMHEDTFCFVRLKKGANILIVRVLFTSSYQGHIFSLRIFSQQHIKDYPEFYKHLWEQLIFNKVRLTSTIYYLKETQNIRLLIRPIDWNNIRPNSKAEISIKGFHSNIIDKFSANLNQEISYRVPDNVGEPLLSVCVKYGNRKNELFETTIFLIGQSLGDYLEKVTNQINFLKDTRGVASSILQTADGLMQEIRNTLTGKSITVKDTEYLYGLVSNLKFILEKLELNISGNEILYSPSIGFCSFISRLDSSYCKILYSLPPSYSHQKKYPLVIIIHPSLSYSNRANNFKPDCNIFKAIVADIDCRGNTSGSYIGEAAFLEILENLQALFNIDHQRIYLVGYSSGANACWVLAQGYPSLFAGIGVISGIPDGSSLSNLSNTAVVNISGELDHLKEEVFTVPDSVLRQTNRKYTGWLIPNLDHWALGAYFPNNHFILRKLLRNKLKLYPSEITFQTHRLKHNVVFWFTIYACLAPEKPCEVRGVFSGKDHLRLTISNIKSFKIKLPPSYLTSSLVLDINGRKQSLTVDRGKDYVFIEQHGDYYIAHDSVCQMKKQNTLGYGILYIYLNGVKVIVPLSYNSGEERTEINKLAEKIAHPKTNSYYADINVKYPICNHGHRDMLFCPENLVIISGPDYAPLLREIKDRLLVKFDKEGFYYNSRYHEGDYSLIFIQENPYNPNTYILVVYANNTALLGKNIFLRKIVLPTYSYGINPYLNKDCLIFYKGDYLTIPLLCQ